MSSNEEPECCSPSRAGWCRGGIAQLHMLASPSSLCNYSWFLWDVCMKVGGEKYVLGAFVILIFYMWNFSWQRVYCYKNLENKAARDLEQSSGCHLVPPRSLYLYYPWCVSDIDVLLKISSNENCFLGRLLYAPFCVRVWLFVVFCVMLLLFLQQNLTIFSEMHKWISLHPICKVIFCSHWPNKLFIILTGFLGEILSYSISYQRWMTVKAFVGVWYDNT